MPDDQQPTDLIARLRARAEGRELNNPLFMADMAEAAAEIERLRNAWLRAIQAENSCTVTGVSCEAKRCGCFAEMELLAGD